MRSLDVVGVPSARIGRGVPQPGAAVGDAEVSVTSGASNTLGAWTQLFAATAGEASHVTLTVWGTQVSAGAAPALLDLGIGGSGSEVAIVSSLQVGQYPAIANQTNNSITFPLVVPAGVRLSCRLTNANASPPAATVRCVLADKSDGQAHGLRSPSRLVPLGANVAASKGVDLTTNDTWTEITAATTEPFQGLLLTYGGNDSTYGSSTAQSAELGIGAAASEVSLYRSRHAILNVEWLALLQPLSPVFRRIPVGTRIVAKASNGSTETITAVVQGIPYT